MELCEFVFDIAEEETKRILADSYETMFNNLADEIINCVEEYELKNTI